MSKFYNLSDETIKAFNGVFKKKSFPMNVGFQFVGSESQKGLIKVSKISDQFVFLLEKELLITINEELMSVFDDEAIGILFEQEIDRISINIDNGKIKLIKPDLTTFSALITKYGIEKVSRANQINDMHTEEKAREDLENEFIA